MRNRAGDESLALPLIYQVNSVTVLERLPLNEMD